MESKKVQIIDIELKHYKSMKRVWSLAVCQSYKKYIWYLISEVQSHSKRLELWQILERA